jgi:sugar lactone lactonase YvrE
MGANEIWRVSLDGGKPEKVAGDLGLPDAVKFDSEGFIVSTQVQSGEVLRIDPRNGAKTVLAQLTPGLDNLTFVGKRLFVSNIGGYIVEVLADGKVRSVVPDGLVWPLGIAMGDDGVLYVADGASSYRLRPGGAMESAGMLFSAGYPGYTRGVATAGAGEFVVTTANGAIARYWPAKSESKVLAEGFDQLYGIAVAPGGAVVAADLGTGRVVSVSGGNTDELANGLRQPSGVAVTADGACLVAESGGGRVVKIAGGRGETLVDGLQQPQGIAVSGDLVYIVDAKAKELIEYNMASGARRAVASGLPVGAPPGVTAKPLRGIPPLSGPTGPFAGVAVGPDGMIYVAGDAEGSVLAIRPA